MIHSVLQFTSSLAKEARHNVALLFLRHKQSDSVPHSLGAEEGNEKLNTNTASEQATNLENQKPSPDKCDSSSVTSIRQENLAVERNQGIDEFQNPFKILKRLKLHHWLLFIVAWLSIYADFVDFLALVIATKKISQYFKITKTHVSQSITLTLLLRPVGAIIFGILGDFYGRKWPLAFNLLFLGSLQIASIFTKTFQTFLLARSFFGIGMGGLFGLCSASIYDSAPREARGLLGGLLQSAIPFASLTVAGVNMAFGATPGTYKLMFWVGAGISYFVAIIRICIPDSPQFVQSLGKSNQRKLKVKIVRFWNNFKPMIIQHWPTFIYCAIFVSLNTWANNSFGNNHFTFLISAKGMNNKTASVVAMLCNIGSFSGMVLGGYVSQFLGRRRTAAICALCALGCIPAAILPTSAWGLTLGCSFLYVFIQAYNGIMPAHLNELSPKAFRAILPGTSYQIGVMIASPAAQIVNSISETHHITLHNGKRVEAYEPVMAIALAIILVLSVIWCAIGPENRNVDLDDFVPAAIDEERRGAE